MHLNSTIALMMQLSNSTNKCSINRIFITELWQNEPYINDAIVDARLDDFFPSMVQDLCKFFIILVSLW